ncbi:MAG: hypothetical protein ACE5HA_11675 [Anaerolineae bacterium]
MSAQESERLRGRISTGAVLIVIGLVLLIAQRTDLRAWALLFLGIGFLGMFFWSRHYGWLVPGGILTGLGTGIVMASALQNVPDNYEAALFLVSFGLGFILIWVLDILFTRVSNWWPLIPGGIMVLIGLAVGVGGVALDILEFVGNWWPLILVIIGAWILFTIWRESRPAPEPPWNEEPAE